MSRTISEGLNNFMLDCDFFTDKKIKVLKANFGTEGITVYIYLLCEVYRNGFYLKVDDDFIYIISADLNIKSETVAEVIPFLMEHSFFDKELFERDKVITSKSVQRYFQNAIKEKAKKTPRYINEYWLLDKDETAAYIILGGEEQKTDAVVPEKVTINRKDKCGQLQSNWLLATPKVVTEPVIKSEDKPVDVFNAAYNYYKANFNSDASPEDINELRRLLSLHEPALVMECMKIAVNKDKRSIAYIKGILKNLVRQGIKTLDDYRNKNVVVPDRFF